MRLIGHLEDRTLAERLSGLLVAQGIRHQIEAEEGPHWAVWVHAEEDLDRARHLMHAFKAAPDDPRYQEASGAVKHRQDAEVKKGSPSERRRPQRTARQFDAAGSTTGGWTLALVAVCGVVAVWTRMGSDEVVRWLQIGELPWQWGRNLELFLTEVRRGEVWRLLTPIFLHFGFPHLLFNLWVFWDLGQAIERRQGSRALLILVVFLGVLSNLGQYLVSGPRFGGMSGVIYGLFGYVWMLGRYCPGAGLALPGQTVVIMLVWFFICLFGLLGVPVANTAHGVGLVAGVLWGRWLAWKVNGC